MNERTTQKIYNFQSYFYDPLVARLVKRRHRKAIGRMNLRAGDRVLDVGIGTGLSLDIYPRGIHVVGMDICEGMLGKARERIGRNRLDGVMLTRADAMRMPFPDGAFDHILISHVITVVSDPVQLVNELRRVGKPGCQIVIINHFLSGHPVMAFIERVMCPFFEKVGWRSDLSLEQLMEKTQISIDYRYKLDIIDFWQTVFITNDTKQATPSQAAMA